MTRGQKIYCGIGILILLALLIFWPGGLLSIYRRNKAKSNPNVSAFLMTIRWCEGTDGPDGYRMLFGGKLIDDLSQHPDVYNAQYDTTAAGAYQFTIGTWNSVAGGDFNPAYQDKAAITKIDQQGALSEIIDGNIQNAVTLLNGTWTSLPGGSQQRKTMQQVLNYYTSQGGTISNN